MSESTAEFIRSASRSVRYAATAALALLALFLLVKTADALDQFGILPGQPINTITVTGEGKSTATPDVAQITFTVQESAATVQAAQDAATKRTNDAIAALKSEGIAEADIKTLGYNVNPQYATQSCPPGALCPQYINASKITGYEVSQTVQVKVRDTNKAGTVLQNLGTLGVQNISGPDFMVDDPTKAQADARGKAIDDARAKAEALAKQLHVRLGSVVSYSENGGGYPVPMYQAAGKSAALDAAVAPSLPTGTNETDVNVSVTYQIK
ncbi:MAG TPA: SIMPL domain-containing protein [Candidatus Paceibacterota bacterium]|jgi:hypothetical protein|nr:SIMPL domain-containing protein [Candidatus Paceibacterota bacterium]